jgi:hypothetical protein
LEIVAEIKLLGECLGIIGKYIYYATVTPSEISESKKGAKKIWVGEGESDDLINISWTFDN